jgi:hypothetical protein
MKSPTQEWMKYVAAPALGLQGLHAHFNSHAYERHAHDYFVIGTIDAGAPKVTLESRSFVAPTGTAMIINPGESHDGRPADDAGYVYSMLYVEPWAITELADELGIDSSSALHFTRSVVADPLVVFGLKTLHRSLFNDVDSLRKELNVMAALRPLLERFSTGRLASERIGLEPRIERVRELIHASFSSSLTTTDLAVAASLSRVRLNQLFSAAYGLPACAGTGCM